MAKAKKKSKKAERIRKETMEEVPEAGLHVVTGRAEGKAARKAVPRSSLADLPLPEDRPDPVDQLEAQAESRVAAADPSALRPDAGIGLHLLPRCGSDHGIGPLAQPDDRDQRPGLWRRPSLEFR